MVFCMRLLAWLKAQVYAFAHIDRSGSVNLIRGWGVSQDIDTDKILNALRAV